MPNLTRNDILYKKLLKMRFTADDLSLGMPNAPVRLSSVGDASPVGRMEVYYE